MRALFLVLLTAGAALPARGEDSIPQERGRQPVPELRAARATHPGDRLGAVPLLPSPAGGLLVDWAVVGLSSQSELLLREMAEKIQRGEPVDPVYYFARVLDIDPQKFREIIQAISQMAVATGAGAGRPGLKSDLWAEFIRRNQSNPAGYAGLARTRAEQGDYRSTVIAYSKAIKLGGGGPESFYGRGFAAEQLGDHELAHADAQKVLGMAPDDQAALSLFKLTAGLPSSMRIDTSSGEPQPPFDSVAPGGERALPARSAVALTGRETTAPRPQEPMDNARQSAELTREAQKLLQMGDADGAIQAASRAATLDPGNAQAHNLLAMALERSGQHARAVLSTDRALELAPESSPALNTRAWALNGLGRFEDALQDSMKVLQMSPNDGYGYLNKARAEGGLGRREDMVASLRRAAELDPRLFRLYDSAVRLPESSDTELLFAGMLEDTRAPAGAGARGRRVYTVWAFTLAGALLVSFGLLQALSARKQDVPGATLRTARRGPAEATVAVPHAAAAGELEQYELLRVIATGGMGVVYEGLDKGLKRRVAIKKMRGEIRDDQRERDRFLREARTVAQLRHPNIVQIHSILEQGPDVYLVFEFVEGRTLKEVVALRKSLPLREAVDIFAGVCAALDYAHGRSVIHRDIKPSNIMVDEELVAKVMDFGVARQAKDALVKAAATSVVWGTPQYMAPEAEEGHVCRESDLYSLGICFYEILTGRLPFKGASGAMFADKMAGRFDPPSRAIALPKTVDALVARALAPEPEDRFPSAKELRAALESL